MSQTVAIVGAGPAGSALACLLAARDINCVIFDDEKIPSLLVGESLVPAAIPILQRLGVEAEVSAISTLKCGAALRNSNGAPRVDFAFQKLGKGTPGYAYNIPRPQFDAVLRKRAETLGSRFVLHHAEVLPTIDDPERDIHLSDSTLAAAGLTRATQPDLLIDATGRSRLFSRALKIPSDRGSRNDVAHFAHFENYSSDSALDGQIVISVLECGWSWQIPLPGKTSVGVVLSSEAVAKYGNSAAHRLETVMQRNTVLNKTNFRRLTDVKTYSNYQLIAKQGSGRGWVLLGDALGFVDPMLSPGVFMALQSAVSLDELVFKHGRLSKRQQSKALHKYYREIRQWHRYWSSTIDYFYDGRILRLGEIRPEVVSGESYWSMRRLIDRIISRLLASLVSGTGTRSRLNQVTLKLICQLTANDADKLRSYSIKDNIDVVLSQQDRPQTS